MCVEAGLTVPHSLRGIQQIFHKISSETRRNNLAYAIYIRYSVFVIATSSGTIEADKKFINIYVTRSAKRELF